MGKRELIEALGVEVDWENSKIYPKRQSGFLENLMGLFKSQNQGEIQDPELERKVKLYKLHELYSLALNRQRTEFEEELNGKRVRVSIEPAKVEVASPEARMIFTADEFVLKTPQGEERKKPSLKEFYEFYEEVKKLLLSGSVENYLRMKARDPKFKEEFRRISSGGSPWGGALLGFGGGILLGYLLGSAMGSAFAHAVETEPPAPEEEIGAAQDFEADALQEPPTEAAQIEGDYFSELPDEPFGGDLGGFDDFDL